jgi:hypothetical protein
VHRSSSPPTVNLDPSVKVKPGIPGPIASPS